jgi:anti-anti-sigma regulatory factor
MFTHLKPPEVKNSLHTRETTYNQVRTERNGNIHISISQKQGRVLVTIVQLIGKLDGSNYMRLVDEARNLYQNGIRDLLIDLSQLSYLSSAGISAIHKTALLFRGVPEPDDESGWASYHAIDRDRSNGVQCQVKLFSPQPAVAVILDMTGFNALFEVYTDLEAAIASF